MTTGLYRDIEVSRYVVAPPRRPESETKSI